ncbi:hypothetical protein COLO4_08117 [Corchorus olitorius]|uniref:Uncharacterized protein n=1 Tax=Corchorus olitorius TaxID=93759 RepID=A0A1R3KH98_9ROSI|nr:hypothetical protein COLO4_08117 [Corchorus olitorius]
MGQFKKCAYAIKQCEKIRESLGERSELFVACFNRRREKMERSVCTERCSPFSNSVHKGQRERRVRGAKGVCIGDGKVELLVHTCEMSWPL